MLFVMLIKVKMPTIVRISTFMSRKTFMLSLVDNEKCYITSGLDFDFIKKQLTRIDAICLWFIK